MLVDAYFNIAYLLLSDLLSFEKAYILSKVHVGGNGSTGNRTTDLRILDLSCTIGSPVSTTPIRSIYKRQLELKHESD
jgi:hypothetical protein